MEARVAVLEEIARSSQVAIQRIDVRTDRIEAAMHAKFDAARDRQDRDFRLLFGALIAAVLGLAGLMAKGFHWF